MSDLQMLPDVIELIRPEDLLNLRIFTENIRLELDLPTGDLHALPSQTDSATAFLVVDNPNLPALLRIVFPPQHIAEFATFDSQSKTVVDTAGVDTDATNVNNAREEAKATYAAGHPVGDETLGPPSVGAAPIAARIAGDSRLVFRVKVGQRIPYTTAGLLDWRDLEPVLHPVAATDNNSGSEKPAVFPAISAPTGDQTSIELPYRLMISPDSAAIWSHRTQPFGARGRFEMWHTRLVPGKGKNFEEFSFEQPAPLRALWSPDYRPDKSPWERNRQGTASTGLGRTALSDDDRHQLVVLTSAFQGYETIRAVPVLQIPAFGKIQAATIQSPFAISAQLHVPKPFHASQLMLSPLGGWLKSRGTWEPPRRIKAGKRIRIIDAATANGLRELFAPLARADGNPAALLGLISPKVVGRAVEAVDAAGEQLDLSEWVHVATQGRDHYVRVVYEGELWPFRHKASMVKITERKFVQRAGGIVVACLVQRVFVVVREPEVSVSRHDSPLRIVRLTTRVTPDLAEPRAILPKRAKPAQPLNSPSEEASRTFWIEVGASRQKFLFHAVGIDHEQREVDFTIPLIFVSIGDSAGPDFPGGISALQAIDDSYNAAADRAADFQGAKVAFTPLGGSNNPLLATRNVLFTADTAAGSPYLASAAISIPSLSELLGTAATVNINYHSTGENAYAKNGYIPANTTGVFAELIDKLPLGFRADQAGGFATPNQTLTALSRDQGPIAGDIAMAMSDRFDAASIFPSTALTGMSGLPTLFGTFGLDALLEDGSRSKQAPNITTSREAGSLVTQLVWEPRVKQDPVPGGVAVFHKKNYANDPFLRIRGEIRTPAVGAPTSLFTGSLKDFDITLLNSVTIHFSEFSYTSKAGEKAAIKVALRDDMPLQFTGDLEFVEDLRRAIPPGLFGEGASVAITGKEIRAGFSIALPPLEIGVFALKDITLGAALTLPFLDGKPILDFNVSERANPFQLRVAFFAGGGFFHLQMDTKGMRQLEASLEFGAAFGLNIAVATGEVHAMAGIYFAITRKDDNKDYCTLTGFMRLGGRLSVIGIIRLSVEFNLSFTYERASDKAYGRATVTVMVEVLLVSVSVALTVERAFGGAGDPVFLQTFPEPEFWRDYAGAFA